MKNKVMCIILCAWVSLRLCGPAIVRAQSDYGTIIGWGIDVVGVDLSGGFVAVAAGGGHSLGLKTDGSIVAWGYNGSGQANIPAPNTGFVGVAGGYWHSLGLKGDGSILAWGCGDPYNYGQCNVPAPNTGFVDVAACEDHSTGSQGRRVHPGMGTQPPR
jgi:alpha-tubulin suppressor-like RCC1 family protein